MRTRRTPAARTWIALLTVALVAAPAAAAEWNVSEGDVRVVCPMTIGGSFEARTRSLNGELAGDGRGVFRGVLAVDLRTLDSGIGLRNTHMRERYLEVDRGTGFERAVLSEVRLTDAAAAASGGRTPFTATLELHGVTRTVSGEAQLRPEGDRMRVQASFPVALPEFGIASPRYLGVGVKDRVTVHVAFTAAGGS